MTDFTFTATQETIEIKVPDFEDARAGYAPYYTSGKSITQAKSEVEAELGKLGAFGVMFQDGYFGDGKKKRYGYCVLFRYGDQKGVVRVAGLPIRANHSDKKKRAVRVQALLVVRDQLKAAVTSRVFSPGSDTLIQYLLVDERRTLVEALAEEGRVPLLAAPEGDFVEGEVL